MTPEQVRAAAAELVQRSTVACGVPYHLEAGEVLGPLADAVIAAIIAAARGRDGPHSQPEPARAPAAPGNPSSPKEKPGHGRA